MNVWKQAPEKDAAYLGGTRLFDRTLYGAPLCSPGAHLLAPALPHHLQKDLAGDGYLPQFLHFLFALFLLLAKLHFARDIAAVEVAGHVLAQSSNALGR